MTTLASVQSRISWIWTGSSRSAAPENRREPQAWQVIMVIEQCQVAWQPTLLENSGEIHDRDIVDGQRDIHGAAAPATRLKKRLQARLDRFKLARVSVYVWYCK
jgi:hypothetical protein